VLVSLSGQRRRLALEVNVVLGGLANQRRVYVASTFMSSEEVVTHLIIDLLRERLSMLRLLLELVGTELGSQLSLLLVSLILLESDGSVFASFCFAETVAKEACHVVLESKFVLLGSQKGQPIFQRLFAS
jgi:hypothetical protein